MALVEFGIKRGSANADLLHSLPSPRPIINQETKEFWRAAREHRFLLSQCQECRTIIWYPRRYCPSCSSMDTNWVEASGTGTIYSFTVIRRAGGDYRSATPYVLAYVELEEGPRVLTNIVNTPEADIEIGAPVRVTFHDVDEDCALIRFEVDRPAPPRPTPHAAADDVV